jgi:hypothetical protein
LVIPIYSVVVSFKLALYLCLFFLFTVAETRTFKIIIIPVVTKTSTQSQFPKSGKDQRLVYFVQSVDIDGSPDIDMDERRHFANQDLTFDD